MASKVERRKCEIGDVDVRINVLAALIKHATKRQTLGMKRLVDICHLDPDDRQSFLVVQDALTAIFDWCLHMKYPMLTSLVVFQSGGNAGFPSATFWNLVDKAKEAKDFILGGKISSADRFTQETFLRYQHLQCFNYYHPLITYVVSDWHVPARLRAVHDLEETDGFEELSPQQKAGIHNYLEALPDPESFINEAIETITTDENFLNGKQRRAFETFILTHNIPVNE